MHKLIALYHPPASEEEFARHLVQVHLPLVARFPGLRAMRYGLDLQAADGRSPYFAIVECEFDSAADLAAALNSPEGVAAAADVPNYATAGVTILTYDGLPVPMSAMAGADGPDAGGGNERGA